MSAPRVTVGSVWRYRRAMVDEDDRLDCMVAATDAVACVLLFPMGQAAEWFVWDLPRHMGRIA